jgi:hypothetical protein
MNIKNITFKLSFLIETRNYGAIGLGTVRPVIIHVEDKKELTWDTLRDIRNKLINEEHKNKREVLGLTLINTVNVQ